MIWPPPNETLRGEIVALEPIADAHREPLRAAAGDPLTFEWMDRPIPDTDGAFDEARNKRSPNALAALSATFEGVFRSHMLMPGIGRRDSAYFSIIDAEWPDVKVRLARGAAVRA